MRSVTILNIVALILTGVWIIRGAILGLTNADLIYNYIYSGVVFTAFILTLLDRYDD